MSRYDIVVATRNSRIRYQCVVLLKRLGVPYMLCAPDDSVVTSAHCVLVTESEARGLSPDNLVLVSDPLDNEDVALRVMVLKHRVHTPRLIVIGVDPGMRFGLAVVIDGVSVHSATASTPTGAASLAHRWLSTLHSLFPSAEIAVHVGTGSKLYSVLFLRAVSAGNDVCVLLVDEHHTTVVGLSDQSSAIAIAGRDGRPLCEDDLHLDSKSGYIKSLKQLVAHLTEGRRVLTTDEAQHIIHGDLSIDALIGGCL